MISCQMFVVIISCFVSSFCFVPGIGGNENHPIEAKSINSLCELKSSWKATIFNEFKSEFHNFNAKCGDGDNCDSIVCTANFWGEVLEAKVQLSLCSNRPEVKFSVNTHSAQWSESFGLDRDEQISEIKHKTKDQSMENRKWYLHVLFNRTRSIDLGNISDDYLTLKAILKVCEIAENDIPCVLDRIIFSFPHISRRQICMDENTDSDSKYANLLSDSQLEIPQTPYRLYTFTNTVSRSSRSSPIQLNHDEAIHSERTKVNTASKIGEECDLSDIFSCGNGAACLSDGNNGKGVCHCMTNHIQLKTKGPCERVPNVAPTVEPNPKPIPTNSSYSSALGAVLSVITLLLLAAIIFFGTKYHIFSRIGSHIQSYYRNCWSFRHSRGMYEDNVTMVNPLVSDDDDPPLL